MLKIYFSQSYLLEQLILQVFSNLQNVQNVLKQLKLHWHFIIDFLD